MSKWTQQHARRHPTTTSTPCTTLWTTTRCVRLSIPTRSLDPIGASSPRAPTYPHTNLVLFLLQFFREMAGPDFDAIRPAADEAIKYIKDMEAKIEK